MFSNIFLSLEPEIPGRCQTGRCIWAPHRSQDLCVPWSLASPRLHARMQVRRKTEKWNVQPTQKMRAAAEEAAMRLRWVSATQCRCVHQLIPYQTWNTLRSDTWDGTPGRLGTPERQWCDCEGCWLLTTPVPVCWPRIPTTLLFPVFSTVYYLASLQHSTYFLQCIDHQFPVTFIIGIVFVATRWLFSTVFSTASPKLSPSTVQQVSIYPRKSRIQTILSECFSAIFTAREKTGCRRWRSPDATRKCAVKANSLHVSMKLTKCLTVNFDNTCEDRRWILPHLAKQGFVPSHHGRLSDDRDRQ